MSMYDLPLPSDYHIRIGEVARILGHVNVGEFDAALSVLDKAKLTECITALLREVIELARTDGAISNGHSGLPCKITSTEHVFICDLCLWVLDLRKHASSTTYIGGTIFCVLGAACMAFENDQEGAARWFTVAEDYNSRLANRCMQYYNAYLMYGQIPGKQNFALQHRRILDA